MHFNSDHARQLLKAFHFTSLFIEELGWDYHSATIEAVANGQAYKLTAIAQKRGVVVLVHEGAIPDDQTRRTIDHRVAKSAHQHLIIFSDTGRAEQVWQWVRREPGKPFVFRQHTFHSSQSGELLLIQKLKAIAFSLEEEAQLHHMDVTRRVRAAFDTERVTRRFYDRFKSEHDTFLDFITGIPDDGLQQWYAAVMLNRLMFIYFVQKKSFLDSDRDYLRTKLGQSQQRGKDRFYARFLCPLFFDGFAKKESERSTATNELLGKVPYLNGGLFLRHQVEEVYGTSLRISDAAFERIFAFFEEFHWHLDERPNRNDREINPDVLGYIFEKYINQKQMGAYYTKEDITGYISQNTIIPFLFDAAQQKCKGAFEGDHSLWRLLQADPDRYMYDAVKHGITIDIRESPPCRLTDPLPFPPEVAGGFNDVTKRSEWNRSAPSSHALPTEIWREVIARRKRYEEVRAKLESGAIHSINDLITSNMDIRQFAQDVIENCERPDLLRAFWHAIQEVTVLDPTCGSGAFLFAALNVLEPLYEACLNRMEVFLDELDRSGKKHRPEKFDDFRQVLDRMVKHASLRSFIYKSIIVNNLYGVDIMEEAVEICKLRLFLKMVAQVDRVEQIEPLPDIDFNIRAGNTLVGYATYDAVKQAVQSKLDFENAMVRIEEKARDIDRLFGLFRQQQTELGGIITAADKQKLRTRLKVLEEEFNRYLAHEYQVNPNNETAYLKWHDSHKSFHWFIEFYGIMKKGGFDVIIGNPPYLDLRQLDGYTLRNYKTLSTKNLYSLVLERCELLTNGRQGYIVPISSTATEGYIELQRILRCRKMMFVSFDDRPAHLFDGLDKNTLSILLLSDKQPQAEVASSRLNRWNSHERSVLFAKLQLYQTPASRLPGCLPRIGSEIEFAIWQKLFSRPEFLASAYALSEESRVFYSRKVNAFLQVLDFIPEVRDSRGRLRGPSEFKEMRFYGPSQSAAVFCLLNSSLFRWFIDTVSDGSHLSRREINNFPFDPVHMSYEVTRFLGIAERLSADLKKNSFRRRMTYSHDTLAVQCIVPKHSKSILDEIDRVLAKYYGFTDEELDFIINYDIKYRMGGDSEENGDS